MGRKTEVPWIVHLLGMTIFALTTAEFMVAGMMPALASALSVSVGEIGYLISLYALGMALGGPVLTVLLLALRIPYKTALLCLLALYVAGAVLAAAATGYGAMAAGRVVMGVASAACFGVSLTICASLVAPEARGRAASVVLSGLMLAPVFGVPVTSLIEQHHGWRASFWAVAALSAFCTALVAWRVPASRIGAASAWARSSVRFATGDCGRPTTPVRSSSAPPLPHSATSRRSSSRSRFASEGHSLAAQGLWPCNVVGNFVVGRLADRCATAVLAGGLVILALALGALAAFAQIIAVSVTAFCSSA